jgi:uncharacterized protein (TIGR02147 family)
MRKYDPKLLLHAASIPDFLKKEFRRRLGHNERYSLRAFARDLDLSPSRLSETMNLKSGISLPTVEKISSRLKLSKSESGFLRDLYLVDGKTNRGTRDIAMKSLSKARERTKIKELDTEKFKVIAEWYHTAILQMTDLKQFRPEIEWIAIKLGIAPERSRRAVERLFDLGLLFKDSQTAQWKQHPELMVTESEIPATAIRQYHRQMMQKAFRAIDEVPVEHRNVQSMTFALPKDRYREVCGKIQDLFKEAWELSGSESKDSNQESPKDSLYAINVQFFPLIEPTGNPSAYEPKGKSK